MKLIRNTKTVENRNFWESVDKVSVEVSEWPGWKRGEPSRENCAAIAHKTTSTASHHSKKKH